MIPFLLVVIATDPASAPSSASAPSDLLGAFPAEIQAASQPHKPTPVPLDPNRTEAGLVPLVGGDTDIGIGIGALGSLAKFDEVHVPYRLRVEALALISFRGTENGSVEVPFQDYYLQAVVPGLAAGRIRLRFRAAFQHFAAMPYYGLGNASQVDTAIFAVRRRYHQFDRFAPSGQAEMMVTLIDKLFLRVGASYTHNWITPFENSKLTEDVQSADPRIAKLARGTGVYGLPQVSGGLIYDSRDHEFVPKRGGYHELSARLSPGPLLGMPFLYGALLASFRQYQSLYREYLVLAARLFGEAIFGDAPFYELGQYDSGNVGGGNAIRGVPLLRYYGKAKVLANIELRSMFWSVRLFNQRFALGVVAFFDAGRVWLDYVPLPALDGRGIGIKYGTGGGVRLQWGDTFVLRADVAWSPDARPIGFYFNAGQAF